MSNDVRYKLQRLVLAEMGLDASHASDPWVKVAVEQMAIILRSVLEEARGEKVA